MTSPFLYLPGERLSEAELTAACLDGHLVALGEGYVPADVVETRALRGASLARMLGQTLAATHLTAAWVHGVIDDPPVRHTVQRSVERRLHYIIDRRLVYRDGRVDEEDLLLIGGARVTCPGRTVADLARTPDEAHPPVLLAWAARYPADIDEALGWLGRRRQLPRRRLAADYLCRLRTT